MSPASLCCGAGGCKGAKSLSGVGADRRSGAGAQGQTIQLLWTRYFFSRLTNFFPDSLFFSRLAIFFPHAHSIFTLRFPCWGEALSPSYPSTGSAPITLSSPHHRFDLYRRQANYTPERGDVLPKLGAFKAARAMSSSHCPIPVPPRPPGIRVSSHDAAVTAAAEEGFEQEGGEQTGRRRLSCGGGEGSAAAGHSSSPFPLHGWVFIRMRERGAEEQPARPRPEAGLGGRRGAPAAGPEEVAVGNCARSGSPIPLPTPWGVPLWPFRAPSPPPPSAHPRGPLSTKTHPGFAGTLPFLPVLGAPGSSPPLAALPVGLGLWGSAKNLGWERGRWGLVARRLSGRRRWVLRHPGCHPHTTFSGRVDACTPRARAVTQTVFLSLFPGSAAGSCDSGCRGRAWGRGGLCHHPGFPFPATAALRSVCPAARGCFAPLFLMETLSFGQRGWLSAGRISLWDFPAGPFSQQLCSPKESAFWGAAPTSLMPSLGLGTRTRDAFLRLASGQRLLPARHFPPANAVCPQDAPSRPAPLPAPLPPAAHAALSVVETLFWQEQGDTRMQMFGENLKGKSWRFLGSISKSKARVLLRCGRTWGRAVTNGVSRSTGDAAD